MKKTRIIASVSAVGLAVGTAMVVPPITVAEDAKTPVEARSSENPAPAEQSAQPAEQPAAQPVMDGIHLSAEDGKILLNAENIEQEPTVFFADDATPGTTFTLALPKDKDGKVYVPTELVDVHSSISMDSLDHSRHVGELKLLDKDSSQSVTEGDELEFTLQDDSAKIQRWIAGVLPAVSLENVPAVAAENAAQDAAAGSTGAESTASEPVASQNPGAEPAPSESVDAQAPAPQEAAQADPAVQNVSAPLPLAEETPAAAAERESSASLTELLKRNGGELNITARKCNPDGSKATLTNGVMGATDPQTKVPDPLVELSITGQRACIPEETSSTATSSGEEATSVTSNPDVAESTTATEAPTATEPTSTEAPSVVAADATTAPSATGSQSATEVTSSQAASTVHQDAAPVAAAVTSAPSSTSASSAASASASAAAKSTAKTSTKVTSTRTSTKTSTKVTSSTSAKARPANSTRVVITAIPSGPTETDGSVPLYVK